MPIGVYPRPDFSTRFWAKVVKGDGCWEWTSSHSKQGYGHFTWKEGSRTRTRGAHILAYELHHGVTVTHTIDHLCRNPGCVNPDHLEDVPARTNTLRGTSPVADNARKTHCPQGHAYEGNNLRLKQSKYGVQRCCRQCARDYAARKRAERRSA